MDSEPGRAGIDPNFLLIERFPDDNIKTANLWTKNLIVKSIVYKIHSKTSFPKTEKNLYGTRVIPLLTIFHLIYVFIFK